MVDSFSYVSFQPVLHDWFIKDRGMCYYVCEMVHIKDPMLLIEKRVSQMAVEGLVSHYRNGHMSVTDITVIKIF